MANEAEQERITKRILLLINCAMLAIGGSGGPLILRLYFLHGGHRVWLSSFLQTAGFPIMLVPLIILYIRRKRTTITATTKTSLVSIKPPLILAFAVIGVLTGLDNYLYAYGVSRLPVSTSALIIASQLAFTAVFAFLLVKQKFKAYTVNAVVLLTLGAGVLALHTNGDRPVGESKKQYMMGFVVTLLAAVLYGFVLPLVELAYKKTEQFMTYSLVLEIQFVMCTFATLLNIFGMITNHDFKVISREAKQFGLGEANYYVVLVGTAILWQAFFLGAIGVIYCASSLLSGIIIAVMLPVTEVLAVIFYKESFKAEKGVSLILSVWGFAYYFYGEYKQTKKLKRNLILETGELPQALTIIPKDQ
ncbi:hypothetical protein Lal_00020002 [Lupinus albus]|uniref:Probable purine permease n=1 Tax=Lupinus albus TaxID=3870 RepID=A0A6A4Q4J5_LUPAL|nr:putative purine permease, plant [Lupinus albus]KAF1871210.1 hypothetical protein Lal_00020002 [Lupinus albus]